MDREKKVKSRLVFSCGRLVVEHISDAACVVDEFEDCLSDKNYRSELITPFGLY